MPAQKCRVSNPDPFTWNDATLFNGYLLLILSYPELNGVRYTEAVLNDNVVPIRIPHSVKLPIRNGYLENDAALWRTDSITPPNVKYSAFYYDSTDRLVSIEGSLWGFTSDEDTISANPFSVSTVTPTTFPFPLSSPNSDPTVETPTGTANGSNTAFKISRAGIYVQIMVNDVVLIPTTDYTLSAGTLTMVTHIPGALDVFKAFIWG